MCQLASTSCTRHLSKFHVKVKCLCRSSSSCRSRIVLQLASQRLAWKFSVPQELALIAAKMAGNASLSNRQGLIRKLQFEHFMEGDSCVWGLWMPYTSLYTFWIPFTPKFCSKNFVLWHTFSGLVFRLQGCSDAVWELFYAPTAVGKLLNLFKTLSGGLGKCHDCSHTMLWVIHGI